MPQTKKQEIVYTVMMVCVMVYGMVCYNIALDVGCCLTALESEVSIPQKLRSCNTPAQISALCIKSFSVLQRHFGTKRRMCCCKLYSGGAARYNGGV